MNSQPVNFINEISDYIFTSKYSRYDDKLERRETWNESVKRLENMHLKKYNFLQEDDVKKIKWAFDLVRDKRVLPSMRSMQYGGKAVEAHNARMFNCSTRHVDSLRSFSEIFYLLLCGCGVDIGLSKQFLDRLPNLAVDSDKTGTVLTYVVEDDIEGWADSVEALMSCYFRNTPYTGRKIVFDYSRIRKKGEALKTGGGKAPGYKGLKNAHSKIKELLDHIIEYNHQNRLKSINAYDILMHCADAVLSGGCRRAATSTTFDKYDLDMINAKTNILVDKIFAFSSSDKQTIGGSVIEFFEGRVQFEGKRYDVKIEKWELDKLNKENLISWRHLFPHRARSNNSVLLLRNEVTEKEFHEIAEKSRLYGEPGYIFGSDKKQTYNPCQNPRAKLLTKDGIRQLKDVNIGDEIWSETGWTKVVNKWSTGVKPVYKYETAAGSFYGTENHRLVSNGVKIEAKDCESIDCLVGPISSSLTLDNQDIMDGLVLGDGSVHIASNNLVYLIIGENDKDYFSSEVAPLITKERPGLHEGAYEVSTTIKANELPKTFNRSVPDRFLYGNRAKVLGFLRGLYTANGSICGSRVTLKTSSAKIREDVQVMLSSVGIHSYYTTNKPSLVKFQNGEYLCKESYDVNISVDKDKFFSLIGFIQNYKMEKLDKLIKSAIQKGKGSKINYEIKGVDFISEEEVFDITVDNEPHTYWTGGVNVSNCREISFIPVTEQGLCGVQFCNLTTQNGGKIKTEEDWKECVEAAVIIGTLQAGYTNFPYLSNTAKELTEEEALLGVSITGMMDNPELLLNPEIQRKMSDYAKIVNLEWAKKLKLNPSARICCIKPEGTSSLVLGTSSGIHPHHSRRYFRRVQANKIDNIYKYFKKTNPSLCEHSVWSANQTDDVITFPIQIPDSAMTKDKLSAIQHLEIIKNTQINWVSNGTTEFNKKPITHNVSCTVVVKDNEWKDVISYLYNNRNYFAAVSLIGEFGDKDYPQAPMEAIVTPEDEEKWQKIVAEFKHVDYKQLKENDDQTTLIQEGSCFGGACSIV